MNVEAVRTAAASRGRADGHPPSTVSSGVLQPHAKPPPILVLTAVIGDRGTMRFAARWFVTAARKFMESMEHVASGRVEVRSRLAPEELRQREALYRLTDRVQRTSSLDQVYVAALDTILDALPCDRASILLFDDTGIMRFVAWRKLSEDYRKAVEGHSPWSRDEEDPAPICIANVQASDLGSDLKTALRTEGIGAAGFYPLIGGGRLIGKFMTYCNTPHEFTADEIDLSLTIAHQVAFAIDRQRADDALRASERRLRSELADTQLLQRISAELIHQENVGVLYEKITDAAMAIMHSDFASLQALHPEQGPAGELQLLAWRGFTSEAAESWEWVSADSNTTCGMALRNGKRVVTPDVMRCDFMAGTEDLATFVQTGIRAAQTTPLFSRSGNLVGMISTHWRMPRTPSERDLRLLDILARQAADLIERHRASDELRSLKDRLAVEVRDLKRLHELSGRLMLHSDITSVLHDLLAAAVKLMHVDKGSVQLYDPREDVLRLVSTTGLPQSFNDEFDRVDAGGHTTCAAAFRQGRRVIVADLWNDPGYAELARAARPYGARAAQSTPILDDSGAVAAMLTTYSDEPHQPPDRELRLLDLCAEVAARQIERKRSEEALSFLAELGAAIAPIGSQREIAHVTCEKIRQHFGAARVNLSNVDAIADSVTVFHSEHDADSIDDHGTHRLPDYLSESAIAQLKAGRVVAICDVRSDRRTAANADAYARWNTGSMLLAPHLSHGCWKFMLSLQRTAPYAWRSRDVELVGEIAARVHMRLERARGEEALAESEAKLREDDRRKDEFLAMLAHELRNPLAPIVNAVNLLGRNTSDDPLQQRVRAIIDRQAGRLTRLVDDLLEVSRITSGRIQLHLEQVTLNGVIQRAVETARPLIQERRHKLQVSLPVEPVWLHADATRIEQVVVNLLNNAAKYTEDGGAIGLVVTTDGGYAVIRVKDTGIGIERDLLPRIFELFTQAERSLDRSSGGLGIGLSLVQRLVHMHGGTVSVSSAVGRGSEFTVRLPLAKAPAEPVGLPVGAGTAPVHALRVLVVDDNIDAAQSFGMLLEASGHCVHLAYDGAAALEAANAHRPEVVFLDIGLPKLDGYEVAKRMRQHAAHRGALLVAMTGYGQRSDRERARAAGFDHHLVKPADFSSIEPILAGAVSRPAQTT